MSDTAYAEVQSLALDIANQFRPLPNVRAIALGGSQASGVADSESDLDIYVFPDADVPIDLRRALITARADRYEIGNDFFGAGDEWVERDSGRRIDIVYFGSTWMEGELDRVLSRHEASVGYTTCIWYTARNVQPLYDRDGWLAALQRRAQGPYPEPLRQAVVAKNHPILRRTISSYRHQITRALHKGDNVSVNHRVAGLLASVFDIIFAVNRLPHPGEKRLAALVQSRCGLVPPDFDIDLAAVLAAVSHPNGTLLPAIDSLLDGLDELLLGEGLIAPEHTIGG